MKVQGILLLLALVPALLPAVTCQDGSADPTGTATSNNAITGSVVAEEVAALTTDEIALLVNTLGGVWNDAFPFNVSLDPTTVSGRKLLTISGINFEAILDKLLQKACREAAESLPAQDDTIADLEDRLANYPTCRPGILGALCRGRKAVLEAALATAIAFREGTVLFLDTKCRGGVGGVNGDPHVRGFQGQDLDFQGIAGSSFALISAPEVQANIELAIYDANTAATFIRAVGIKHHASGTEVVVESPFTLQDNGLNAAERAAAQLVVTVNNKQLGNETTLFQVGPTDAADKQSGSAPMAKNDPSKLMVAHRAEDNKVQITAGEWSFTVERNPTALHVDLGVTFSGSSASCSGILCETLKPTDDGSVLLGDEMSYMVTSILASDCTVCHGAEGVRGRRLVTPRIIADHEMHAVWRSA